MDREQEQIIRTEYSELMQKSYIDLCDECHCLKGTAGCA